MTPTPRSTNVVRRLQSARSAVELSASALAATVQLVTVAVALGRALHNVRKR